MLLALCAFPLVGSVAPRALSFLPAAVGLLGFGAHYFIYKIRVEISKPALIIAGSTLALAFISCIWSIDPSESLDRCVKMLPIFFGGVLLFSLVRAQDEIFYEKFPKFFVIAVLLTASYNAFEMLTSGLLYNLMHGKGYEFVENLSHLNRNIVVMTLCLLPAFMITLRRKQYALLGALVIAAGLAFAITDSQSAHLAFLVGLLTLTLFPVGQKWAWGGLWAVLSALLLATPWLAQYMFDNLPQLIENIYWFSTGYAPHRMEIWDFVSRYALQNPLYGFGIESTKMVEEFDSQMLYHGVKNILHPHNFAVQFWMEFGVIGPLFLMAILAYTMRLIYRLSPAGSRLSLALLMAFISTAATGYGFWQSWLLGAVIMIAVYCNVLARSFDLEKKA